MSEARAPSARIHRGPTAPSRAVLEPALATLADTDLGVGDLVVQHTGLAGRPVDHHQVFQDGRLAGWHLGRARDPDLCLELRGDGGGVVGTALPSRLDDIQVRTAAGGTAMLAPLDEFPGDGPHTARIEIPAAHIQIPDADLDLWIDLAGAPLPEGGVGLAFRDGHAVAGGLTRPAGDAAAVTTFVVSMSYVAYLDYRLGGPLAEALVRRPSGSWAHQMLAAGLYDGPEHRNARDQRAAEPAVLAAWRTFADVLGHPAYQDVVAGGAS